MKTVNKKVPFVKQKHLFCLTEAPSLLNGVIPLKKIMQIISSNDAENFLISC